MSGGSYTPPVGKPINDCSDVDLYITLASPDSDLLKELSQGDILVVYYDQDVPSLSVQYNGDYVGEIIGADRSSIIKCIRSGYTFQAIIVHIESGHCDIEILPMERP